MLRSLQLEKRVPLPLWDTIHALPRQLARTAAMFLLTRAELPLRASPLAPAFLAACLGTNGGAGACVLGCVLGMARLPLVHSRLIPAFSCLLVLALQLLSSLLPRKRLPEAPMCAAFIAGVGALLPPMIAGGGAALPALQAFACGALAACCAPYLLYLMEADMGNRRLSSDEKIGLTLLLGGCLAGLQAIFPPGAEFAAALWVLCAARHAPLCGAAAGLALWTGGGIAKAACMMLCAAVCSSSLLRRSWQRALAMCASAAALHLAAGAAAVDARWALCAAAAYLLIPEAWLARLEKLLSRRSENPCDPALIARELSAGMNHRLNALAEAFSAMAEPAALPPDVPDEQELIQQMRTRLCAGCIQYGACWAGESNRAAHLLCRLIGEALERTDAPPGMRILFSDGEIPPDVLRICRRGRMIPDRLGLLLRDFAEKRRSEIKRCETNQLLSLQLTQAAQILRNLARQGGGACGEGLRAALERTGMDDLSAVSLQGGAVALVKNAPWQAGEIRRVCAALERSLRLRYQARCGGAALRLSPLPLLQAQACSSCQSGLPGQTCGDSHLIRMLDERRMMLAICDGMGTGEAAHEESLLALRLLSRFLDAGISPALALETLNQQLLTRSGDELFSTLDLCIIDLGSGIAEMTKLAACRTILLRGDDMLRIDGGCLPLGIVERVQPGVQRVRLRPGDLLVMGSDGVMEAGDDLLVEHALRESAFLPPDQLAEHLVRLARLQGETTRRDDLTCICARIARAE